MTDDFLYHYKYLTTETHVTVTVPEMLGYHVGFATIGSEPLQVSDTWILREATLPSQYVRVWWWQKSDVVA